MIKGLKYSVPVTPSTRFVISYITTPWTPAHVPDLFWLRSVRPAYDSFDLHPTRMRLVRLASDPHATRSTRILDAHVISRQGRLRGFAQGRLCESWEIHVYKERSFPSSIAPYQSTQSQVALSTANLTHSSHTLSHEQ